MAGRHPFACPKCSLVTDRISLHMRRQCFKHATEDEFTAALNSAKERVWEFTRRHMVLTYDYVGRILGDRPTLSEIVAFLEKVGHTVIGQPATEGDDTDRPTRPAPPRRRKRSADEELPREKRRPAQPSPPTQPEKVDPTTAEDLPASRVSPAWAEPAESQLPESSSADGENSGGVRALPMRVWTAANGRAMQEMGLYTLHSVNNEILHDFELYLGDLMRVSKAARRQTAQLVSYSSGERWSKVSTEYPK